MAKTPSFSNLLKILKRDPTAKPALFELFMNPVVYEEFAGHPAPSSDPLEQLKWQAEAYAKGGYDYVSFHACSMSFTHGERHKGDTISLNEGGVIKDWESFRAYPWPDPDSFDYSHFEKIVPYLPEDMKIMVMGPSGVLENTMALVGYDDLCYMVYEEPELAQAVFDAVGSRLVRYYENALQYPSVGLVMSNDDWGFNTQPFLSPEMMRQYVFPWHKKIVEAAHKAGRPAVLHSCGNPAEIMEDIIEDMQYDARHSYEDNIIPVEEAYRRWGDRIAIMGGMDVDFLVRQPVEAIRARCQAMLELTKEKGGYCLGSGNSIPTYIPMEHYLAMVDVIRKGE